MRVTTILVVLGFTAFGLMLYLILSGASRAEPQVPSIQNVQGQTDPVSGDGAQSLTSSTVAGRIPAKTTQAEMVAGWDDTHGKNLGPLDAAGIKLVNSYLRPLLNSAGQELDSTDGLDMSDPELLLKQANAVRRCELWKAAGKALQSGSYVVIDSSTFKSSQDENCIYQQFPIPSKGKNVSIVFILDRQHYPNLFGAVDYESGQHRFLGQEAARKYNSLPTEARSELFEKYKMAMQKNGWMSMSEDLRRTFPIDNAVDEKTLIMYAPR